MFNRLVEITDMEIVEINQEIAKKASQIRAEYKGFKAMDALQLAVAFNYEMPDIFSYFQTVCSIVIDQYQMEYIVQCLKYYSLGFSRGN